MVKHKHIFFSCANTNLWIMCIETKFSRCKFISSHESGSIIRSNWIEIAHRTATNAYKLLSTSTCLFWTVFYETIIRKKAVKRRRQTNKHTDNMITETAALSWQITRMKLWASAWDRLEVRTCGWWIFPARPCPRWDIVLGKPQKKVIFFVARPLRLYSPTPRA